MIDQPANPPEPAKRGYKRQPKAAAPAAPLPDRLSLNQAQFTGLYRLITGDDLEIAPGEDGQPAYRVSVTVLVGQLPALLEKL